METSIHFKGFFTYFYELDFCLSILHLFVRITLPLFLSILGLSRNYLYNCFQNNNKKISHKFRDLLSFYIMSITNKNDKMKQCVVSEIVPLINCLT